jgi:hypothetical protein
VQITSTVPIVTVLLNAEAFPVFSSMPPADLLTNTPLADLPTITSVSSVLAQPNQTITITGSGFGSQQPYDGTSLYIQVSDLTDAWNAGYGYDAVGLNVTSWTSTEITIQGFTGSYGVSGWILNHGDHAQVQVWNAQTGEGPALYNLTIQ